MKQYKIYVVGSDGGYSSWTEAVHVNNMEEADFVLFTGGSDISPSLYNDVLGKHTYTNPSRDEYEVEEMRRAISLGKPMWGTCRGAQLLCAIAGGKLVQHVSHPYTHNITFYDGTEVMTNSIHHQMQHPYSIPKNDYTILAYAEGLSNIYLSGRNVNMIIPTIQDKNVSLEPEFVYYHKIKGLGIQGHPEMMGKKTPLVRLCQVYLGHMIEGTLDKVLKLRIPTQRLLSDNFEFSDDENQIYNALTDVKTIETPKEAEETIDG